MREETSKSPLVSIVLPTYNRAYIISGALQSVLNQIYHNFEIIVVDDGSTDNTEEIIRNVACKDSRVKYFRNNENKGASGARNVGINLAKGEFIAFQDDDDEWRSDKLVKQVNLLQTLQENFAVVYSGYYNIIDGEKIYISLHDIYPYPREGNGNIYNSLLKGNFVATSSILVRKSALLDVGLFDENLPMSEDWELFIRLSKKYLFKFIDEPLHVAYYTPNSLGKQSGAKLDGALRYLIKKHIDDYSKDKKALGSIYFLGGAQFIMNGEKKLALKYLLSAIKNDPFQPKFFKFLIAFIISLFSIGFLKQLIYLKRKFKRNIKW